MNTLQELLDLVNETFVCDENVYPDLKFLPQDRHRNTVIKHSTLHMMKSAGKLAGECEHYDHGGEFDDKIAKEAVLKNFANLCKIASQLGMTEKDIYLGVPEIMK